MSLKSRPTSYTAVAMATLFLMSACGGGDAEAPPPPVSVGEPSPNPPAPNPPAPNPPAPNPPAPPAPTPPAPPPPVGALLVTDFDESEPPAVQEFGGAGYAFEAGPTGGDGLSLRIDRAGGENFAGAFITTDPLPLSANRRTITARVYSPEAGIPFVLKAEYVDGNGTGQGTNTSPSAPVVAGWQTLTFVLAGLDFAQDYTRIVILPDLGNVGAGEIFYVDDITLLPEEVPAPPPPAGVDITITDFEESSPRPVQEFGGAGYAIEAAPAGGDGNALKITRPGGEVFAGAYVSVAPIPFSAERKTITARVFSPTAGTPMVAKAEFGDNTGTGEVSPQEAVVQGWQTLTWVFNNVDLSQSYTRFTILPNLGTVGTGQEYFFDDITLLAAPVSGGGGGGGDGGGATPPPPPPPPVGGEMGSGGPQTLTVASGDVKTGDGGNTMFVAGEALFSVNFLGSAEPDPPFNQAAWPDARTDNFAGITGISGGDIGYFQDDVNLSNASQKIEEGGWVVGTSYAPLGVPNFFRYFVLSGRVSDSAYMGLYVNAPNNGTVDVSSYSKIKIKVWGPAGMYERDNFDPVLQVTLTGPKVAGCTTGSGGSEITQNLTANQKNGAGGFYTMSLSGFTVSGLCEGDAGAADVLANLARVVVVVPGTSFNYTNTDTPQSSNYTSGVNLGPIGFTNR